MQVEALVHGGVGVQVHGVTGDGVAAGVWEDWETGEIEERGPFHLDLATGILADKWGIFCEANDTVP